MSVKTYTCGTIFPSGCVLYTAAVPSFIDEDSIPCNARLDDILDKTHEKIEEILDWIDLTDLDTKCYDFDAANGTVKELQQEHIDKVCDLLVRIGDLEDDILSLDISSKIIEIDLGCLSSDAAPCQQGTNEYTLLSILLTFKSAICDLRDQLAELQ